jgi:hypothetical protein
MSPKNEALRVYSIMVIHPNANGTVAALQRHCGGPRHPGGILATLSWHSGSILAALWRHSHDIVHTYISLV